MMRMRRNTHLCGGAQVKHKTLDKQEDDDDDDDDDDEDQEARRESG